MGTFDKYNSDIENSKQARKNISSDFAAGADKISTNQCFKLYISIPETAGDKFSIKYIKILGQKEGTVDCIVIDKYGYMDEYNSIIMTETNIYRQSYNSISAVLQRGCPIIDANEAEIYDMLTGLPGEFNINEK